MASTCFNIAELSFGDRPSFHLLLRPLRGRVIKRGAVIRADGWLRVFWLNVPVVFNTGRFGSYRPDYGDDRLRTKDDLLTRPVIVPLSASFV